MRVLAVQSHVVSGYCGNKCAVFPLQLLGVDVDAVSTVQLSNHTGYPVVKGLRFDGNHLKDIFQGLQANHLHTQYTHVLAGYLGSPSLAEAMAEVVTSLKALRKDTLFVLDPVLGDHDRLYVPKELIHFYKTLLCPLADVITPNQFEAEQLTGIPIRDKSSALSVLNSLHELGPSYVVITSTKSSYYDIDNTISINQLTLLCSFISSPNVYTISFPEMNGHFTGTGDLFAALLLGYMALQSNTTLSITNTTIPDNDKLHSNISDENDLQLACARALWVMQQVLQMTANRNPTTIKVIQQDGHADKPTVARELEIVRSKRFIEQGMTLSLQDIQQDQQIHMNHWKRASIVD